MSLSKTIGRVVGLVTGTLGARGTVVLAAILVLAVGVLR